MGKLFNIILFVFYSAILVSQVIQDNRISEELRLDSCSISLRHRYILVSSLELYCMDNKIAFNKYSIRQNKINFIDSACTEYKGKLIKLNYRYLPIQIRENYSLIDSTVIQAAGKEIDIAIDLKPDFKRKNNKIIDSKTLDYNGSFSRGFSVGNAQSLVVDSKFDLQLQGEIENGLLIKAAISDANIPIQAEGNTQVLQEFDRVFIEISKDKTSLNAGDYIVNRPESYFMNYYKKVKGLGYQTSYKDKFTSSANVTTSRGKFARQFLSIKEGNQGPYKLNGNNNERFIIVLSGTERIFFNGELLRRGQENDYTIDYNLAEVTFTPSRLIARETRIIVEFEYTDQNYFRTLYTASNKYEWSNSSIIFNFYSEQDSKKSTGQIELDSTSISILERVGDNDDAYGVSNIRRAKSDESIVKYELIRNPNFPIDKNEYYLQFSNDESKQLYTSSFSEVQQGKGSYVIDPTQSLNGRVYKFVGEGRGNYEAVNRLIPPERKQMMDISFKTAKKKQRLFTNLALSNFDKNNFSSVDDNDNLGFAGFFKYDGDIPLIKSKKDTVNFTYGVSTEAIQSSFNPLNQYRSPEFIRDWNFDFKDKRDELVFSSFIGLSTNRSRLNLFYNRYTSKDLYSGNNIGLDININYKDFVLTGKPTLLSSSDVKKKTYFLRPNFKASQRISGFQNLSVGFELEAETNEINSTLTSRLDSSSFQFYYTKSFISFGNNKNYSIKTSYNKRIDQFANLNKLDKALDIEEYELSGKWDVKDNSQLSFNLKLRNFDVLNANLAKGQQSKTTVLGGIDHILNLFKDALGLTTNYLINSGQEPKLEYVFQKIENIRGEYIYVGSDTAKIKNVNDFRYDPGNPLASYTRFVIPNNEFTTTNNVSINQSIKIEPFRYWSNDTSKPKAIVKFIKKLTNNTLVRMTNKTLGNNDNFEYFNFSTNDTSLVSYQRNILSTTMFNRGNAKYDISYIYRNNGNKSNQVNGNETRVLIDNEWKLRWNVFRNADLFFAYNHGSKKYFNLLFAERNFDIMQFKYNSELSVRFGTKMRLSSKYSNQKNRQTINKLEKSDKNEVSLIFNRRQSNIFSLDLSLTYARINYQGSLNSFIQYDMLEGLLPGSNYLWNVILTRRLSKFIDLTFSYEGRKTASSPIINVGKIQAKATF